MDAYDIRDLAKLLLELSLDFKLIQTTKTLYVADNNTVGNCKTVVEYTIEKKESA